MGLNNIKEMFLFHNKEYDLRGFLHDTVFINGGRAEWPGFECMNARLGRPENADLYFI